MLGGFASSATGTYSFLDKAPPVAADQYRLKIEDLNGTITYSKIVTLMYGNLSNSIAGNISVYPNPASTIINLAITQSSSASSNLPALQSVNSTPGLAISSSAATPLYGIKIINITGSVVKAVTSSQANWQDNVSGLVPGTYVIQVENSADKSIVGKSTFVKL